MNAFVTLPKYVLFTDLQLKTTSGDVTCSTVKSGTPENMGIAVGISSIAALEPEICWG